MRRGWATSPPPSLPVAEPSVFVGKCLLDQRAFEITRFRRVAMVSMKLYGGTNYDANGYPPTYKAILGKRIGFDANITVFSIMTVLVVGAAVAISAR